LSETKLEGSGGYVIADITEEQAKKADLGVGKLFLAPIGKLEEQKMKKHYCKNCEEEFNAPPKVHLEENNHEEVADNLVLIERGQYTCQKCDSTIGEYRVFEKQDESEDVGKAKPKDSP
jgi:ribosomal protein L37AE/L43A